MPLAFLESGSTFRHTSETVRFFAATGCTMAGISPAFKDSCRNEAKASRAGGIQPRRPGPRVGAGKNRCRAIGCQEGYMISIIGSCCDCPRGGKGNGTLPISPTYRSLARPRAWKGADAQSIKAGLPDFSGLVACHDQEDQSENCRGKNYQQEECRRALNIVAGNRVPKQPSYPRGRKDKPRCSRVPPNPSVLAQPIGPTNASTMPTRMARINIPKSRLIKSNSKRVATST